MKKLLCVLLIAVLLLSLAGCGKKEEPAAAVDNSPVTVLISSSGNSEAYFRALKEAVQKELGIEIEFVYQISGDSTNMTRLYLKNNRLPADIAFCASHTEDALLRDSCLDLLSHSSVTAAFTPGALKECTTADGKVYQLPISSKLIGITYNETLLNEMGRSVPRTFEDMLELKAACDEAGIVFAVCDGVATGHGFNWMFHSMGAQWLSGLEGTEWFNGYMNGTKSIDAFKEKCEYLKKWKEAGLFGIWNDTDWMGNTKFSQWRALFWYGLTNSVTSYDGPQFDLNGNETGVTLHDTYKSMPWISEDGSNNVYTRYDNCWVVVNRSLEAPEKQQKLEKVMKIIEFLTTQKAIGLVTDLAADTYVSVSGYEPGADRTYSGFLKEVTSGYLQPWYYNEFDSDSIVFTGEKVNNYISGKGGFDEIFTELDIRTQNRLNAKVQVLANFPEELGFENTAKFAALGVAAALNKTLEQNGYAERADVTIMPYTPDWGGLPCWRNATVSNSVIFKGPLDASMINATIPNNTDKVCAIRMTGAELKALTEKGYDPSDRFIDAATGETKFDAGYGPYPYVVLVKDGAALQDDKEYLVAMTPGYITNAQFTAFSEAGKVLQGFTDPLTLNQGVSLFVNGRAEITPADLVL